MAPIKYIGVGVERRLRKRFYSSITNKMKSSLAAFLYQFTIYNNYIITINTMYLP